MKHLLQHYHYSFLLIDSFSAHLALNSGGLLQTYAKLHLQNSNFFCRNSNLFHILPLSFILPYFDSKSSINFLDEIFLFLHIHRFLFGSSPVYCPTLRPIVLSMLHLAFSSLPDSSPAASSVFQPPKTSLPLTATTPFSLSSPETSFRYTIFCLQFLLMYTNIYSRPFTAFILRLLAACSSSISFPNSHHPARTYTSTKHCLV